MRSCVRLCECKMLYDLRAEKRRSETVAKDAISGCSPAKSGVYAHRILLAADLLETMRIHGWSANSLE